MREGLVPWLWISVGMHLATLGALQAWGRWATPVPPPRGSPIRVVLVAAAGPGGLGRAEGSPADANPRPRFEGRAQASRPAVAPASRPRAALPDRREAPGASVPSPATAGPGAREREDAVASGAWRERGERPGSAAARHGPAAGTGPGAEGEPTASPGDGGGDGGGFTPPGGGFQVSPVYPEAARRAGAHGTSLLRILVGADGMVGQVVVDASAGHPELDRAAVEAVRQWRFEPARRGGHEIAVWIRVPVQFRLE
jgi:protein TonB